MESNKFDNSIKDKLESRSLQPSNNAWAKLSERLEKEDKKQNNKAIWWLGIAASIVGVLFVAFQFFNTEDVKPVIVDSPRVIQKNENIQVAVDEVNVSKGVEKEIQINEKVEKLPLEHDSTIQINEGTVAITKYKTLIKKEEEVLQPVKVAQESLTFEAQKVQDVVAKVQLLKDNNQEVSDAVIDALLLEAQQEIRLKQLYNKTSGVVDANMLLQDVENDLDQSFRSKVFEAIKASYNSVKTAVAQRND
ncbi:hypothetical protein CJ739_2164 [Mariniflexile rhizosphaerae]|uniref:hypothetical protein n=1 Tax=unclassified Mariniflexile TaxID=2643887 RepID=UPI000CC867D8|nr:hypothetical protein [Mariniflexile sp. TRM1-10]AXP81245.1 hypothetical protein CJ739_2164 [Mariniflexile sp. TRM1-10]PLB18862.1 MAG: hypothetical protein TRG1_2376 [Flavobacteriaceae bacterium FS1-H7996/R]